MNTDVDKSMFTQKALEAGATNEQEIRRAFDLLGAAYQEPHRAYHTLSHIEHGLSMFETLRDTLAAPAVVAMAYWFHDAVYKTTPLATNEADSAKLAHTLGTKMGLGARTIAHIEKMVLATKRHELPSGVVWNEDTDLETLLDVDLSILASDARTYARFERDVRIEYSWVPEALYASGRKKALAHFLDRASIYHRPMLSERWEATARRNLTGVLVELSAEREAARGVHTDDTCIFTTVRGRLELELRWNQVSRIIAKPLASGPRASLQVYGADMKVPVVELLLDDPASEPCVSAIRKLTGYAGSLESAARAGRGEQVVYAASGMPYR